MQQTAILAGSTDQSVLVRAFTPSTGAAKTDITNATSGLEIRYKRGATGAVITVSPLVSITSTGAHADGGIVHLHGGLYRVDLPDAAFAAGVPFVTVTLAGVADCVFTVATVDLTGGDPRAEFLQADVARWRGTQPNTLSSGRVDVTVGAMQANVMTAAAAAADLTTELQAGLATAAALTAVAANITDLLTRLSSARAGYLDNLNVGGAVASASALQTVDNEVGVIDGLIDTLVARVPAEVSTAAQATTIAGYLDTEIVELLNRAQTLLDRLTATRAGYLDVLAGNVPADVKQINGATVNGNGTSGNLWRGA